jgi:hypothetical protein
MLAYHAVETNGFVADRSLTRGLERAGSRLWVDCIFIGSYLHGFRAGWWSGLSILATMASLVIGIWQPEFLLQTRHAQEIWFSIAAGTFLLASYLAWRREHALRIGHEVLASAFLESVGRRLNDIILGWEKLNEDYQNSPKQQGQAAVLPNPMDPGWVSYGFQVWPYRVGCLQSSTVEFRRDLSRLGFQLEGWDFAHMSMAQLLSALKKYKERIQNWIGPCHGSL